MLTEFWSQLKSGTDIRGVASEGVENEEINLTDDVVHKISKGFAKWLSGKCKKPLEKIIVSVGHDSRISAERIESVVLASLQSFGITCLDCGLSSTPAMFMTTLDLNCDGAIQITASHHPFNRNGLKFFTKNGGLDSSDITSILEYAQEDILLPNANGSISKVNYMARYSEHLRNIICSQVNAENYDKPLEGFRIVVDAGNGAGGFYAKDVLQPLGADTSGSQFLEPDGRFPNHIPNPENKQAIESARRATVSNKADLGVIFDTDVDRGGAIDSNGTEINRNRLVALASEIALEGHPGGTIVTDSITSTGLKKYIEGELGGVHHRFKRGYKNVINEAIRLNSVGQTTPLAIETSGHAAFMENHFLDDGAYLVTKIIIKMAVLKKQEKTLSSLLSKLEEPKESTEIRLPILSSDFKTVGNNIIEELKAHAKKHNGWCIVSDNYEGIRVECDKDNGNGWFLLRLSVHDPIMPLNVESDTVGGNKVIINELSNFLSKCDELDTSLLKN